MKNNPHASDPAFPVQLTEDGYYLGLTKREWLAGQALAAMSINPNLVPSAILLEAVARSCVRYADAVLEELGK